MSIIGTMRNIFVFVADSLRYDYLPNTIREAGTVIKTLAPALYTSTSFASLITARSPENHNVRTFFDVLDPKIPTIFSLFRDGSYFDDPADPMSQIVLRQCPKPKELSTMQEPFIWIERALDTHIPYAGIKHGNDLFSQNIKLLGKAYIKALARGEINRFTEYQKGVDSVEQHFWSHVSELQSMGVYDNTLIIFTSDHGELLGEYWVGDVHNYPPCNELVEVPTVFLNQKVPCDYMRTIDILPTALGILNRTSHLGWDGIDVRKSQPQHCVNISQYKGTITLTIWKFNKTTDRFVLNRYYKKLHVKQKMWLPLPLLLIDLTRKLNPFKSQHRFLL
jgi:hypothetical protein